MVLDLATCNNPVLKPSLTLHAYIYISSLFAFVKVVLL